MNENTGGIHVHERSAELHERHHGKPCNRDRDVRFRVFAQQWRGSVGQTIYAAFPPCVSPRPTPVGREQKDRYRARLDRFSG